MCVGDRPVAEMHQVSLERVALLSKVSNVVLVTTCTSCTFLQILYPNMTISEMLSKVIEPPPVMSGNSIV